jgi:hypothetical protein
VKEYWSFFEMIDEDLYQFSRFVEFRRDNLDSYSVHLLRLYLAIGSEVDVVAKLLCATIDPTKTPGQITEYQPIITGKYPKLDDFKIHVRDAGLTFTPWQGWNSGTSPAWWQSYNDVKHKRHIYFRDAKLENVLTAAAGLLVLLVYLCQKELFEEYADKPHVRPDFHIFSLDNRYVSGPMSWATTTVSRTYNRPKRKPRPCHQRKTHRPQGPRKLTCGACGGNGMRDKERDFESRNWQDIGKTAISACSFYER